MKKLLLSFLLLFTSIAFGQTYPSPTYNNLTVHGTFTLAGGLPPASLAAQAANTVLANATSASHSPTAVAIPSCSTSTSALQYTSGTGFTCYASSASLTGATFTGNVSISTASATESLNDTSGTNQFGISFQSSSVPQWATWIGTGTRSFLVQRYVSGAAVDNPISISNSTGLVTLADGISVGTSATFSGPTTLSSPSPAFTLNDTSGTAFPAFFFNKAGTNVWALTNNSGTGTLTLNRYISGTLTDSPISISNSTGVITMADGISGSPISGSTGSFTTLAASSTVSGAGITALFNNTALTGVPTAPTATAGTNTTQVATTAFVTNTVQSGRLLNVQVFSASGTYTPTSGTNSVIVEIQGAGGGAGGIVAVNNASQNGAAGGYIKHRMTSAFSGATVTIGVGGTGGTTAGTSGGTGGNTSFAGITANGGIGGGGVTSTTAPANTNSGGPLGGTASGGNIANVRGNSPTVNSYGTANNAIFGVGASSPFGSGAGANLNANGNAATGFGAGGGGTLSTGAAYSGGAGTGGYVVVWEYN